MNLPVEINRLPSMKKNRVALLLLTSTLTACVGTTITSDRLPELSTLAQGEGLAFGSILVTTPDEIGSREQQEMIDALRERELTATVRRFVRHGEPGGEFTWRDYQGDEFLVTWRAHDEHPFVLRGPAGAYEILKVKDLHDVGFFGGQHWCELESPENSSSTRARPPTSAGSSCDLGSSPSSN